MNGWKSQRQKKTNKIITITLQRVSSNDRGKKKRWYRPLTNEFRRVRIEFWASRMVLGENRATVWAAFNPTVLLLCLSNATSDYSFMQIKNASEWVRMSYVRSCRAHSEHDTMTNNKIMSIRNQFEAIDELGLNHFSTAAWLMSLQTAYSDGKATRLVEWCRYAHHVIALEHTHEHALGISIWLPCVVHHLPLLLFAPVPKRYRSLAHVRMERA